jgi:hypothetical protein
MKKFIAFFFLLCFSFACAKEHPVSYSKYKDEFVIPKNCDELLLTELDDMTGLFPFNEKLDPKDPSLCVEAIAKKQQQEFLKAQEEIVFKSGSKK